MPWTSPEAGIQRKAPAHAAAVAHQLRKSSQTPRHSTLGQISPAAFERRAVAEGVDAMENCPERSFPTREAP